MSPTSGKSLSRSTIAAYLLICAALSLLLAITFWGCYRDMQTLRQTLLKTEVSRLRSHAERVVSRLEHDLDVRGSTGLEGLGGDGSIARLWEANIPRDEPHAYVAIVSHDHTVVFHSDASRQGHRLHDGWYNRVVAEIGSDVFETSNPILVDGKLSYDVSVPIRQGGRTVGAYHEAFTIDSFDAKNEEARASFLAGRTAFITGVLIVVLLAAASLYYLASRLAWLRKTAHASTLKRATDIAKMTAGLAHEIRNPLHAIRLNLHSFRRSQQRCVELDPVETAKMIDESTREIIRIDQLLQQLVGFAPSDKPCDETIDLAAEISDVADFIRREMADEQVEMTVQRPVETIWVRMDRGRLRKIMLNLLQNAQQAMHQGGKIEIALRHLRDGAQIEVSDDGPGIPESDVPQIFDPFFSTKANATGLGLALVERFIDEVDGEIHYETNSHGGATFRIVVPEAKPDRAKPSG